MRIAADKEMFITALDAVTRITERKEDSIFSNVLLNVGNDGTMLFTSQDGEGLIQFRVPSPSLDFIPGLVLLSPLAVETIKRFPKGIISLDTEQESEKQKSAEQENEKQESEKQKSAEQENEKQESEKQKSAEQKNEKQESSASTLIIKSSKNKNKVATRSAEDFPKSCFEKNATVKYVIKGSDLKKYLQVLYACGNDESRPILEGVKTTVDVENSKLEISAMDGFRLSRVNISGIQVQEKNESLQGELHFVLNAKKLQQTLSIFANAENVTICITEHYVTFLTPQSVVACKQLQAGEFPDVSRFLNTPGSSNMKFKKSELLEALERSSIYSVANNNLATLKVAAKDNSSLSVCAKNAMGEAEESLQIESNISSDLTIHFNGRYLIDALKHSFEGDTIVMLFSDATSPVYLLSEDSSDLEKANSLAMVLPVRMA